MLGRCWALRSRAQLGRRSGRLHSAWSRLAATPDFYTQSIACREPGWQHIGTRAQGGLCSGTAAGAVDSAGCFPTAAPRSGTPGHLCIGGRQAAYNILTTSRPRHCTVHIWGRRRSAVAAAGVEGGAAVSRRRGARSAPAIRRLRSWASVGSILMQALHGAANSQAAPGKRKGRRCAGPHRCSSPYQSWHIIYQGCWKRPRVHRRRARQAPSGQTQLEEQKQRSCPGNAPWQHKFAN